MALGAMGEEALTESRLRTIAGLIPDCLILLRRLLGEPAVSRPWKAALALVIAYLAMPFDLIPDFLPVIGLVDDALVVVLVLRGIVRSAGAGVVRRHWPGPERSLRMVLTVAGGA
jgi:uncharacterized membrane protein YkvA (DUF1232 family)